MTKKVLIIMDPLESINIKKDTTYQLIISAQEFGHKVYYLKPETLSINSMGPTGKIYEVEVSKKNSYPLKISNVKSYNLSDFDFILMRKDPPVDNNYIYMTHVLDSVNNKHTRIINPGFTLRNHNEKLITLNFPEHIPKSLVTCNKEDIQEFKSMHKKIILKPLNLMGGRSVYFLDQNDKNFNVIFEEITNMGKNYILAQKYIEEAINGDKRIITINGKVFKEAAIRIPNINDHRSNLASGGTIEKYILNKEEISICKEIASFLKKERIYFAGIDMIGKKITEINITSPTCIAEINQFHKINLGIKFWELINESN